MRRKAKLAILDMNNREPNQGLRCIKDIAKDFEEKADWKVFDVRAENQVPDMTYDIFICSGGPGDPHEEGEWRDRFLHLVDSAWRYNQVSHRKKYFFFICHSFQIACKHFQLGAITRRKRTSFGVYPIHKTKAGMTDPILMGLPNPYHAVDSRDWQLIQPRLKSFEEHGARILSLERIRTHVEYERAIMAVRFSPEFVGTQFHPEADPEGMRQHFSDPKNRETVIRNFDEKKYEDMMKHLEDPEKIKLTHKMILPHFITEALKSFDQYVDVAV